MPVRCVVRTTPLEIRVMVAFCTPIESVATIVIHQSVAPASGAAGSCLRTPTANATSSASSIAAGST